MSDVLPPRSATEQAILTKRVRSMKVCSSQCPMFDECLLMPLAVKPTVAKDRLCLVNLGSRDLRMAYVNLFLGEQSGLVDEIQRCFISYLKETEDIEQEFKKKGGVKLSLKDHDRLLVHREKMMAMLIKVHEIRFGQKKGHGEEEKVQKIKLVEIGADGREVKVMKDDTPMSKTEMAQFEVLEERKVDDAQPDPESLVFSQLVKEKILPSMDVLPQPITTEKPAETGKPQDHPLLKQFFPGGTMNYNTGHFEKGVWIPDCNRCGACCRYLFFRAPSDEKDYLDFESYHGVKIIGHVAYVPATCQFLTTTGCSIHEDEDRPDCCKRFGYGGYHHPTMCQFFGGKLDKELYPDDYRHTIKE